MRNTAITVVFIAAWILSPGSASAQNWGRPSVPSRGACFYQNADFEGRYFCVPVGGTSDQVPAGINDQISSIRVFGNTEVTVFRDRDYKGRTRTFAGNVNDLREEGFNDRISSYRVDSPGYRRNRDAEWENEWGRPPLPQAGACFYKSPNFGGDYFCSAVGATVAQVPRSANDKISSIQVLGNVEVIVFRDSDYRGESRRLDVDLRDLRRSGWNDRISSYRIEPLRFSRGRGRGRGRDGNGSDQVTSGISGSRWTYQQAEAIVARAYRTVFNRDPDADARGWVDTVMQNNWDQQQLMDELKKSPEYLNSQRRPTR